MGGQRNLKRIAGSTALLGLALLAFGSVWGTTLFPRFEKIPSDWRQVDEFRGAFTVIDEPFLASLQESPTLRELLSDPGAQGVLADPAVQAILGSPAVMQAAQGPNPLALLPDALLRDPAAGAALSKSCRAGASGRPGGPLLGLGSSRSAGAGEPG